MYSRAWFVILFCSLVKVSQVASNAAKECATNATEQHATGNWIGLVMAKLDYLQAQLQKKQHAMELGLKERDEEFAEKMAKLATIFNKADHNLAALQELSQQILTRMAACANHEQMRKEISQFGAEADPSKSGQQLLVAAPASNSCQPSKGPFRSCKEAPEKASAVYPIKASDQDDDPPFEAFCEQNSFGGGWLVIQSRFDGSLEFYRNWTEYRNGFGSPYQEHWLGLERLHRLTSWRPVELLIEIKDFQGAYRFARYKEFEVGNETELYALKKIGAFSGTAGDSLGPHIGSKFTTKDRDNDLYGTNCAVESEGAWWYNSCHYANLNGKYLVKEGLKAMCWYHSKNKWEGLAYSRMMIRER